MFPPVSDVIYVVSQWKIVFQFHWKGEGEKYELLDKLISAGTASAMLICTLSDHPAGENSDV